MDALGAAGIGAALLAAGLFLDRGSRVAVARRYQAALLSACISLSALAQGVTIPPPVAAFHTETTSSEILVVPPVTNGYRVYLSSPRHTDSGSRGECGWAENRNGRNWNMYAQNVYNGSGWVGFANTRYRSIVSPNAKDGGYVQNATRSNNWGADVHIVTHTNADNPCNDSTQYLLVMFSSGVSTSKALRTELIDKLDPAVPGGSNTWNCDNFYECNSVDAPWRAYVELFFHTSQNAVDWYQAGGNGHGEAMYHAWQVSWAVDEVLGYPR